ncbi:hypothetical protein GS399_01535 [Pedobacter sp. HMF7647]|uniref:Uncharacterized protein n=1 Tax=Hufsiella arboris TaxID=2695275 RepID=A0A7K1Y6H3_9SPHI|nr:hypothetical protein [Hufsiella arboris]MXV49638.1 hypothetical protein [Hufsiella arboris]
MKKLTPYNWVVISLVGFIVFLAFFYFIIRFTNQINLSPPVYFMLVIFIDLIATAFIGGALRSVAKYNMQMQNK